MAEEAETETEAVGRCLCGAVQFKVTGEPIYNVVCHCENCKRTSGSTFHTASIYFKKQYTLLQPPGDPDTPNLPNITVYADYATQSGLPLYRRFCAICGAKISALTPLNEAIISVPAGILPNAGKEWKPHKEQFVKDKAGWVPELGDLVKTVCGPGGQVVSGLKGKSVGAMGVDGRENL